MLLTWRTFLDTASASPEAWRFEGSCEDIAALDSPHDVHGAVLKPDGIEPNLDEHLMQA